MVIKLEKINCDFCGSDILTFFAEQKDLIHKVNNSLFKVVTCNKCGLKFTNPRPVKESISNFYSDKYTFILSGGEIFNDMERKDLENQDILFTNKDKSFLIHSNNLTLYNGKIFLVKMNEETKTVYLTENKTRKP